jgi:pyruvate dehydrogenase E2 component (dihydrolipoamide acetyltransferase)
LKSKTYKLIINGEKYEAKVLSYKGSEAKINVNGIDYLIEVDQEISAKTQPVIDKSKSYFNPEKVGSSGSKTISGQLVAPIPGVVINIHKNIGDVVDPGDVILSLEAMKMESELVASITGRISEIKVSKGDSVLEGELLVVIEPFDAKTDKTAARRPAPSKPAQQPRTENKEKDREVPVSSNSGSLRAPIPGTVLEIRVKEGDPVTADDTVIILEAMKMESEIRAGKDGKIKKIRVNKGDSVNEGDVMMEIGE